MELKFADDNDLMEGSEDDLKEVTRRVEDTLKGFGMKISAEKSKVMVVGKKNIDSQVVNVMVGGKRL